MSVPRILSSKYKFNAGSRTNLIVIKPEKCKINEQKQFLKLGLLNIRSLTPKAVIVNEIITDNSFDVLCLTETWLKTNDYFGLNESTPPSYCYKHEPRETGRGGGVATIYSDILNVTQKTGYRFDSFEILMLNVKRYRPGRIIIPATKDRFTNNLPDLSQLLCVPINTDELDAITSNMGTIFSNTLETVAPIKLKKG